MFVTPYRLPFVVDAPMDNPWSGAAPVDVVVATLSRMSQDAAIEVQARLTSFYDLVDLGALAGRAIAPWQSACPEPSFVLQEGVARVRFAPTVLDEKATQSLICLLLSAHEVVPLQRATISVTGMKSREVQSDPSLTDPYPQLWERLPFQHDVEDSDSETRVLRVEFASPLLEGQALLLQRQLHRWGAAAAEGAFAIAPLPPRACGCLPFEPIEAFEREAVWPIYKCRFDHRGALDSLVATCATIHRTLAPLVGLTVE
jgi:hypothetical protein